MEGAFPMPEPAKNIAPTAAIEATQRTAEGPSVKLRSNKAPKHPTAAPTKSNPYTRPIGKGLRVRERLTTIPEKKKGTAMVNDNSANVMMEVNDAVRCGTNVIWTIRHKPVVMAKAEL